MVTSLTNATVAPLVQLSEAVTAPAFAGGSSLAHATVIFIGHVIVGAMMSFTTMVCTHVAVLPQRSEAWYVRRSTNLFVHV